MKIRNGFSLIEMLIAIIFITILMTALALSSSSMKATARADKVIKDMYAWKTAALMWYHDHKDEVKPDGTVGEIKNNGMYYAKTSNLFIFEVAKYLDNVDKVIANGLKTNVFKMTYGKNNNKKKAWWCVRYDVPADPTIKKSLLPKLKARAEAVGLYTSGNNGALIPYNGTNSWMYMKIIEFDI